MNADIRHRVEQACDELTCSGKDVTFVEVAALAGVSRASLYRNTQLRALVEGHKAAAGQRLTLTGLALQVEQLSMSLEAVAAKVRRHEEALRRLSPSSRAREK